MPYEITISGINTKFNKCIDWVTCKVDTPATSNARTNYVGNYMNISGFIGTDEATVDLYQWAILPINESNVCRNVELTVKDANDNVIEKISFPNAFVQYYKESYSRDKGLGKFDLQLKQRIDKNGDIVVSEASAEEKIKSAAEEKKIENVLGKITASGILDTGQSGITKGSQTGAEKLYNRAQELQSLRNDWDKRNGTTSVMRAIDNETGEEVLLVSTNSPRKTIIPEFEGKLKENEVYIGGEGHAEQTIIENSGDRYTPIEGGSSRNVCKGICQPLIESKGMDLGGPEFRGREDKTKYRQFWEN